MTEILITISIVGLVAGFIFSMPIAGPISILITSNALKGKLKYCNLFTVGASVADFIYVFVAVFGITKLYSLYKPAVPYILGAGGVFIIFVGYKIIRTKFDLENIDEKSQLPDKIVKKDKGAFYAGFMINILNPTLFFGWLTTSFIVISFVSSLGFNTGGLNTMIDENVKVINDIKSNNTKSTIIEKPKVPSYLQLDTLKRLKKEARHQQPVKQPVYFPLLISLSYAFSTSLGSIIWFLTLATIIVRFRKWINIIVLNWIIRSLGIVLCLFGVFFGYTAVKMFL
jgi:threonine/homoserine/homoserine lactone efflux protein